jgi:branched-chain amino acid transport system permease protein
VLALGPVTVGLPKLISFAVLIILSIALFFFLKVTPVGKQIRAVSQNPIGAQVVGIDAKSIYMITYGMGAALAGISGALLTLFNVINPTAGSGYGFRALIVVVVGGLGSIPGAFFAGIFLGLLETLVSLFIGPTSSSITTEDSSSTVRTWTWSGLSTRVFAIYRTSSSIVYDPPFQSGTGISR